LRIFVFLVQRMGLSSSGDAGHKEEAGRVWGSEGEHSQCAVRLRLLGLTRIAQILRELDRSESGEVSRGTSASTGVAPTVERELERVSLMCERLTQFLVPGQ
jgi:hypothetical protein